MKTIIIQNIDGYDVITSLSEAGGFIDPVETRKAIESKIKETETVKRVEAIHKQMNDLARQGTKLKSEVKELLKLGKKNEANQAYQKSNEKYAEMKAFEPELKSLFLKMKEEYKELMISNAVYFQPKPGEEFVEDVEAEEIKALLAEAIPNGQLVTKDKKKIVDNRGKEYWQKSAGKWHQSWIDKIGLKPNEAMIYINDLTESQRKEISLQLETERISKMSKADKAKEKEQRESGLRNQAVQMRNELEISNDKDALKKAQEWLAAELTKLDEVYK
ncbi:MAG: hypothetical protein PVG39_02795 [Desulfobacteraceae bacterium]|jgi:hypothetical protein